MSFFNELKRRNVFRVGIAYAVVAWLVMQFADVVLNNITAPGWVFQVIMLLLAIGFPIVLIIAWAFEMTPEGLKKEKDIDRSQSITPQTGRKLDRVIIAFMAVALVYFAYDKFNLPGSGSVAPEAAQNSVIPAQNPVIPAQNPVIPAQAGTSPNVSAETPPPVRDKSVAVLPFANRSTNPEDEFFAEGMHDDLLTQLAKIGAMKVISRTSVMEYKNTTKKLPEIAKELGVATIVEGGVQRSGSRIRFNAQLIDAKTDEHLWAETYNRELTAENLFDIQAEIARSIAGALQATLSPAEEASIHQTQTTSLEAWESYQRAVRLRQSASLASIQAGISEVNRALELDPRFAAAWSLKAILLLQRFWFFDTDPETRDAALDAIQQGRAINPTLAELDLAQGYYHYWGFRDYEKALPFMNRAVAALPNSARAHNARAFVSRRMGHWDDTLADLSRATELDPRNGESLNEYGATLVVLHRFDPARTALERAQELNAGDANNLWSMGRVSVGQSGDINGYFHFNHLMNAPHPTAQVERWRSSLYLRNFAAALKDVQDWPERFLETKDMHLTRPMLEGLTRVYAGDTGAAQPLLLSAKRVIAPLEKAQPGSYPILRSLCFIAGGLGDLTLAQHACADALTTAPKDAYVAGDVKFDTSAGLALAGDAQGAVALLKAMLDADAGPTIYPVIYHPAFDGIRDDPAYVELLAQYGPEK